MTCTFFGHRDCDESIYKSLKNTILELIQNENVTRFVSLYFLLKVVENITVKKLSNANFQPITNLLN